MGWIDLATDRDQWWALVSMEIKLPVPQNAGEFLGRLATVTFSRTRVRGFNYLQLIKLANIVTI
jgi:hypothetical protein